jgi:hypothetical protein
MLKGHHSFGGRKIRERKRDSLSFLIKVARLINYSSVGLDLLCLKCVLPLPDPAE